ncbi:MAG: RNA pyrophosphohydrolase [Deltaproteobacteria bacterium]|nr:RNA pyrophosphohydrolase [Deltaproteobacteria bacterium]
MPVPVGNSLFEHLMSTLPYRKNVAVFVVDQAGNLLGCERSDRTGAWQIPQGGVEEGEDLLEAMLRELEEEIGTRCVDVIDALTDPIRYDWPPHLHSRGFAGQEQYYFLVRLTVDTQIDLARATTNEFQCTEWMTCAEFLSRVQGFKSEAYAEALRLFRSRHPEKIR